MNIEAMSAPTGNMTTISSGKTKGRSGKAYSTDCRRNEHQSELESHLVVEHRLVKRFIDSDENGRNSCSLWVTSPPT